MAGICARCRAEPAREGRKTGEKCAAYGARYQAEHADHRAELCKAWRQTHPERARILHRRTSLKNLYGLSLEEHEILLSKQGGRCAICSQDAKLGVDHDHQTGQVRGLLCQPCNLGLGAFQDDAERLRKALDYLDKID